MAFLLSTCQMTCHILVALATATIVGALPSVRSSSETIIDRSCNTSHCEDSLDSHCYSSALHARSGWVAEDQVTYGKVDDETGFLAISKDATDIDLIYTENQRPAHVWADPKQGWRVDNFGNPAGEIDPPLSVGGMGAVVRDSQNMEVYMQVPGAKGGIAGIRSRYWTPDKKKNWVANPTMLSTASTIWSNIAAISTDPKSIDIFFFGLINNKGYLLTSYWRDGFGNNWNVDNTLLGFDDWGWPNQRSVAAVSPGGLGDLRMVVYANLEGEIAAAWTMPYGWEAHKIPVPFKVAARTNMVAVSRNPAWITIVAVATDGSVWEVSLATDEVKKAAFVVHANQIAGPGSSSLPGFVAAASRASQSLDVFWTAPDGSIVTSLWTELSHSWKTAKIRATPCLVGRPIAAVARRDINAIDGWCISTKGAGVLTHFWEYN